MKWLLLLLLLLWVYWLWRSNILKYLWQLGKVVRAIQKTAQSAATAVDAEEKIRTTQPRPTAMLPCTYCGVHVPGDEVVVIGGVSYCSLAHAKFNKQGV
jgi:hypothetical protein